MSSTKYSIAIQRLTCVYQQLISNLALSVLAHKMYLYKQNAQNLSYTDLRSQDMHQPGLEMPDLAL